MVSQNWTEIVRTAAGGLGLLDENGALVSMDSLVLIDFVVELERLAEMDIPGDALRADMFESVDTVAAMLASLKH